MGQVEQSLREQAIKYNCTFNTRFLKAQALRVQALRPDNL